MPTVNVLEVARVAPPATPPGDGSEGSPLLGLSALEVPWIALPLIQHLLIFVDNNADAKLPPFASMVAALRASLAATLARFPPLAGRIVFLPATADAAIDCSCRASDGVRFVVAEIEDADAARLAGDADHDTDAFRELVPELETGALPAEVLAVQVTRLKGGAAIGVAMHHAVVDGRSVWRILEAWAAACRGGDAVAPAFERAVVAVPGGEELVRSTLRKYSPDLPLATMIIPEDGPTLPRRTFTVTAPHIHRLKQRITGRPHKLTHALLQLRGPGGAHLGVLRPVQAPLGHLPRRRRVPLLLRRLPRAPRDRAAGAGDPLRDLHLGGPRQGHRAGPPGRGRAGVRGGGGAGGGPARGGGPAGALGLDGAAALDAAGPAGQRLRVHAVPGVRGG